MREGRHAPALPTARAPPATTMAVNVDTTDLLLEERVAEGRGRLVRGLVGREAAGRGLVALAFLAAALPFALLVTSGRAPAWWLYAAFVVAYAAVASIQV